jgi:hypothetical protein
MLHLPQSPDELVERLRFLHEERKLFPRPPRRLSLTPQQRATVLDKTDSRCHLCGGEITENKFAADHVLSHAAGGKHKLANYLAAHRLCNGCRWFYSSEQSRVRPAFCTLPRCTGSAFNRHECDVRQKAARFPFGRRSRLLNGSTVRIGCRRGERGCGVGCSRLRQRQESQCGHHLHTIRTS